jgi:hypothetical protein
MYLMDPDTGRTHRKQVRRKAEDLYDTAADSATAGWQTVREQAGPVTANWRAKLSDRLADASRALAPQELRPDYGLEYDEAERLELTPTEAYTAVALSRHSRDLHGQAREAYARARDMYYDALIDLDLARTRYRRQAPKGAKEAKRQAKAAAKSVRAWGRKAQPRQKPDYLTISLVAAGCCAAGAAAMFILDPAAGRRRRALVRDKTYSAAHRTSEAVSGAVGRTTRYVRDYSQGKVAQAKTAFRTEGNVPDEKLVARVRSEMGRVVSRPHQVEVRATNGSVTLGGTCLASEFDALMKCVYGVEGVREVINRVETQPAYASDVAATGDMTAL